jgi:hypothetical protein
MRNKNLVHKKLENLDSTLNSLQGIVKRGESREVFFTTIQKGQEIISELQDLIEQQQD